VRGWASNGSGKGPVLKLGRAASAPATGPERGGAASKMGSSRSTPWILAGRRANGVRVAGNAFSLPRPGRARCARSPAASRFPGDYRGEELPGCFRAAKRHGLSWRRGSTNDPPNFLGLDEPPTTSTWPPIEAGPALSQITRAPMLSLPRPALPGRAVQIALLELTPGAFTILR